MFPFVAFLYSLSICWGSELLEFKLCDLSLCVFFSARVGRDQ